MENASKLNNLMRTSLTFNIEMLNSQFFDEKVPGVKLEISLNKYKV